jgi:hypothetical protein
MVRCYGVSLVRNRAVILLDAVKFSLQPPLDQMAMLNSLAYSVNSAYGQLLSKGIQIDFARTTTGRRLLHLEPIHERRMRTPSSTS